MSEAQQPTSSPPAASVAAKPSRTPAARIREAALVLLLITMLAAMWYDYKVARPAIQDAYDRIAKLNVTTNTKGGRKYMTEKDVQTELQRTPIETFSENDYFVEVYGWRAGLPIMKHHYYAVYTEGSPHIFLTQYMGKLDREDLRQKPAIPSSSEATATGAAFIPHEMMPEAGSRSKERQRPSGTPDDTDPALGGSGRAAEPAKLPAASDAPAAPEKPPTDST